ncbi:MAG: hypothetical protein Q8L37_01440 [Candidatus Gottesmanbacteria bacterium]|nr:hypothetical protein [Candidatus Gottesmanbacteria bacterium]
MGELVSQFDPTDQSSSVEGETGGGGDKNIPENPWRIPGGLAILWPEAVRYGWTEDIGLDSTQKAVLVATKKLIGGEV